MKGKRMVWIKYVIDLSKGDRALLRKLTAAEKPRTALRANILLASDRNNPKHMTMLEMAKAFHCSVTTVQKVRKSYADNGLNATVTRKRRYAPPRRPKVSGELEARIIALAHKEPPTGCRRWTTRLLAEKCMELGYIDSISHTTIQRWLKKEQERIDE